MFQRSTTNATHNSRNSNALRNAEEEFGALKRKLELREAQRRCASGLPFDQEAIALANKSVNMAPLGQSTTPVDDDLLSSSALSNSMSIRRRQSVSPHRDTVPLFEDGETDIEIVRTAHKRHNRVVVAHRDQWSAGSDKLQAIVTANDASSNELALYIDEAKAAQSGDPPVLDSKSTVSNYMKIRETMRAIANCGSTIDESDVSPNDFSFLDTDASLSSRERVLLQRLKDVTSKLKVALTTSATLKEQMTSQAMDFEGLMHDAREAHKEQVAETLLEHQALVETLESDVSHWKTSSATLQDANGAIRAQLETERQAAKVAMAEVVATHKEEVGKWMVAVATGDREKHQLAQSIQQLQSMMAASSSESSLLTSKNGTLERELAAVTSKCRTVEQQLASVEDAMKVCTGELTLLRAARPTVVEVDVQVDSNALLSELRDSLLSARSELTRLRTSNESMQKKLTAAASEVQGAAVMRKELAEVRVQVEQQSTELSSALAKLKRNHQRRMQLLCTNVCLRATVLVLQRPNGFGDRMEMLQHENRWLMEKLEQSRTLKVMSSTSGVRRVEDEDEDDDRADHALTRNDMYVAEQSTQTGHVVGNHSSYPHHSNDLLFDDDAITTQPPPPPLMWKSVGLQCTPDIVRRDLKEMGGADGAHTCRQSDLESYMEGSEGKKQLEKLIGTSRIVSLVANRFRRALAATPSTSSEKHKCDDVESPDPLDKGQQDRMAASGGVDRSDHGALRKEDSVTTSQRPQSATGGGARHNSRGGLKSSTPSASRPASATANYATSKSQSSSQPQCVGPIAFCVQGVRDEPQLSVLTSNPTQYFTKKRASGLSGAQGKRREFDLLQHAAMDKSVTVDGREAAHLLPGAWVPTAYVSPSTFPIRTLDPGDEVMSSAPPTETANSHVGHIARPLAPMATFMPATRNALGSWKPRQ